MTQDRSRERISHERLLLSPPQSDAVFTARMRERMAASWRSDVVSASELYFAEQRFSRRLRTRRPSRTWTFLPLAVLLAAGAAFAADAGLPFFAAKVRDLEEQASAQHSQPLPGTAQGTAELDNVQFNYADGNVGDTRRQLEEARTVGGGSVPMAAPAADLAAPEFGQQHGPAVSNLDSPSPQSSDSLSSDSPTSGSRGFSSALVQQSGSPATHRAAARPVSPSGIGVSGAVKRTSGQVSARRAEPQGGQVAKLAGQRSDTNDEIWLEVATALREGDRSLAERKLYDLQDHGDMSSQGAAKIGLAELWLSQGELKRACAELNELRGAKLNEWQKERVRLLLKRCPEHIK